MKKQAQDTETTVFDIAKPNKAKPNRQRPQTQNQHSPRNASGKCASGKSGKNVGSEPAAKEPLGLRIIGGKFRGSKLQYSGDNRVRPMKDRVREAVFNLIGPAIKGMHAVDLFGGTGAMAIEAISRGTTSATIIELHLPTASLLKKNLESLDLLPICNLCKTDAFFWVKNETEHPAKTSPWIIFCSPPYEFYISRQAEMSAMLHRLFEIAPAGSLFVIEADERFDLTLLPRVPDAKRIRFYPPAVIAIFSRESVEPSSPPQ